jgi:hypothetical protein
MEVRTVPLKSMARLLRVTEPWLRSEAEAGRIPHLKAGEQLLFNPELVEQLILRRASQMEVANGHLN